MFYKSLIIPSLSLMLASTSSFASSLSCFTSQGYGLKPVVTLTYDSRGSEYGSLEVYGESYQNNLELEFSRSGPLKHGYIPETLDFRVQSFVPTAGGYIYAKLAFPLTSPSSLRGQTFQLLCRTI